MADFTPVARALAAPLQARSTEPDQPSRAASGESGNLPDSVTAFSCLILDLKGVNNERLAKLPEEWEGLESRLTC